MPILRRLHALPLGKRHVLSRFASFGQNDDADFMPIGVGYFGTRRAACVHGTAGTGTWCSQAHWHCRNRWVCRPPPQTCHPIWGAHRDDIFARGTGLLKCNQGRQGLRWKLVNSVPLAWGSPAWDAPCSGMPPLPQAGDGPTSSEGC